MILLLPSPPPSFPAKFHSSPPKPSISSISRIRFPRRCAAVSPDVDTFTQNSGYLFQLSVTEAESLEEYDIVKIGDIYKRKPLILLRRLFQIGTKFGGWFGARYIDGLMDRSDQMFKVLILSLNPSVFESMIY